LRPTGTSESSCDWRKKNKTKKGKGRKGGHPYLKRMGGKRSGDLHSKTGNTKAFQIPHGTKRHFAPGERTSEKKWGVEKKKKETKERRKEIKGRLSEKAQETTPKNDGNVKGKKINCGLQKVQNKRGKVDRSKREGKAPEKKT